MGGGIGIGELGRHEFHRHLVVLQEIFEHGDAVFALLRRLVADQIDHRLEIVHILLPAGVIEAHAGDGQRNHDRGRHLNGKIAEGPAAFPGF